MLVVGQFDGGTDWLFGGTLADVRPLLSQNSAG